MKQISLDWLFEKLWELEQAKKMENEQTAVQWLVEKIQKANPSFKFDALIRQAKQMEKEQIIKSYKEGHYHLDFDSYNPEQYYNETFKSE